MLGIDDKTMRQIASMPGAKDSWIAKLIQESPDLDELENKLANWLLDEMYPDSTWEDLRQENYNVLRIVRTMFPLLLMNEGVIEFLNQNPKWIGYLPEVNSPSEAAEVGAMDVMYVPTEQTSEAAEWLAKLNNGSLKPQPEAMQPSQPASSDLQS
jgi:hypothetical protein